MLEREDSRMRVSVDRIYERGGVGRAVGSVWIPAEKSGAQDADVEQMSRIAPK